MNCIICFDDLNVESCISCENKECETKLCKDCFKDLIKFNYEEKDLPKCVNTDCNVPFLLRSIKPFGREYLNKYLTSIFRSYLSKNKSKAEKIISNDQVIDKLRKSRIKYIEEKYPLGIALVAKLAFSKELKKINRDKQTKIKESSSGKKCMFLSCKGYIEDNKCNVCETEICEKCEKKKTENHECKQSDIDTVNYLKNVVKCPKCSVNIEKSYGCNMMTCTSCKHTFDYQTGEDSGGNHHNQDFEVKNMSLVNIYGELCSKEELSLLLKIEAKRPKNVDETGIINVIKDYLNDKKDKNKASVEIAKKLQITTLDKLRLKSYNKIILNLEEDLMKNDKSKLEYYFNLINNY